jgi:hypothetical protein
LPRWERRLLLQLLLLRLLLLLCVRKTAPELLQLQLQRSLHLLKLRTVCLPFLLQLRGTCLRVDPRPAQNAVRLEFYLRLSRISLDKSSRFHNGKWHRNSRALVFPTASRSAASSAPSQAQSSP